MRRVALKHSVALRSDYCQRGPVAITRDLLVSRAILLRLRACWRAVPRCVVSMLAWFIWLAELIDSS